MNSEQFQLVIQGGLLLALGVVTLGGLRFLQRLELHAPPVGARRVHLNLFQGDPFPLELFPEEVARRLGSGEAFFLYSGPSCCVCKPVVKSLPFIAADYPKVRFVLITNEAWEPFPTRLQSRIDVIRSQEIVAALRLKVQPYAIKVVDGKVVDYGVVNSAEHVESLLGSNGTPQNGHGFVAVGEES